MPEQSAGVGFKPPFIAFAFQIGELCIYQLKHTLLFSRSNAMYTNTSNQESSNSEKSYFLSLASFSAVSNIRALRSKGISLAPSFDNNSNPWVAYMLFEGLQDHAEELIGNCIYKWELDQIYL